MKLIVLACALSIVSAVYTDVDDKIDIEALDKNGVEMEKYFACYLDKGPCTPTMMSYKKHFDEVFHDNCANCTPLQKHIGEEFLKTGLDKYPELVKELQQKYDPKGNDFKSLINELAQYNK